MNPEIQNIIDATVDGEPTKVQSSFENLIGQKIMDALEARKREIASTMFNADVAQVEDELEAQDAKDQDTQSA